MIKLLKLGVFAAAAVIIAGGIALINQKENSLSDDVYTLSKPEYPQMATYPNENNFINALGEFDSDGFQKVYSAWKESVQAQKQDDGYADGLTPFFTESIRQFLSLKKGENCAFSPLSVYMSLGMTAELTGGNSRQQILDLLNAENIDSLRKRANAIWNAHYHNDGATSIILASSVWLDSNIEFSQPVMDILAQNYYASSYAGVMGSDKLNQVFYQWLDEQTGGLLKNNAENIKLLDADTLMSLATTVLFQAKWDVEFNTDKTSSDTFHALSKDITCDFMHSIEDIYYWGDKFGAVSKKLENYGGTMWFILPDEGVAIEDLINDNQAMEFILSGGNWENQKRIIVNFALPKFDIFSQTDLSEGFKNMGVTDIFDGNIADFSPMLDNGANVENIFVSKAQHDVKVSIDEEGVTAATYTVMRMYGAPPPPEDEIDFILNRPFLFAIADDDGLPLFVGIVNYPK